MPRVVKARVLAPAAGNEPPRPMQVVSALGAKSGRKSPLSRAGAAIRSVLLLGARAATLALALGAAPVLGLALIGLSATESQAQEVTLVSNFPGTSSSSTFTVGDANASEAYIQAQKFTTGSNANGYVLSSVKFKVGQITMAQTSRAGSASTPRAPAAIPGPACMCCPAASAALETRRLPRPRSAALEADTEYFVVFEDTNSSTPHHHLRRGKSFGHRRQRSATRVVDR